MTTLSLHEASEFGKALTSFPDFRLKGNVVKKMTLNLLAINKAFPDVGKEYSRMLKKAGEPKQTDPGYKDYLDARIAYDRDTRFEVELQRIRYEELNIGDGQNHNHIPPAAVAALMPMINMDEGQ